MVSERKYKESDVSRRIVGLVPAFALVFAVAVALPVSIDTGFAIHGAFAAGNGNGGGKGKALGKAGAPGQQQSQTADADEQAATVQGGAITGTTDSGSDEIAGTAPEDATNQVIQELAGLPENSALTEEEEKEAIRSGWGTWRTADGPGSVMAQ